MSTPSFTVSVTTPAPPDYDEATFAQGSIGKDLLFTSRTQVGASRDYLLVVGGDRVAQKIMMRLAVSPGEYKLRPGFGAGVPRYLKRAMGDSDLAALEREIRQQLAQDALVERVETVTVSRVTKTGVTGLQVNVRCRAIGTERNYGFTFEER